MSDKDQDIERLKKACVDLSEFFENVQIFASRVQDKEDGEEGTVTVSWGSGNWFARKGQVDTWVLKQNERSRMEERGED